MSFVEDFHEDFSEFLRVYARKFGRIFVMIEDLDRCDPIKAAELLKAINLLIPDASSADQVDNSRLDSKEVDKLVFIIAIDRAKVAAGLAAMNRKLARYISDPPNLPASQIPSNERDIGLLVRIS